METTSVLKKVEYTFPRILLERLAEGRPSQALLDGWSSLEAALRMEPEAMQAALQEAALFATAQGSATVAPRSALGFAVVDAGGDLVHADSLFLKWFGPHADSIAFRRLTRLALKDGQGSGLVEAEDGAALAACAGVREAATGWPLPTDTRAALAGPARRVVLLCFAPSRAGDLAARASDAFGLTPLEARLAEALLDAPNLEAAAKRIGVGRETAREALKKAMKKAGARRSPDLVRRMMDLMCGDHPTPPAIEAVLASNFGATAAEARAAARFAQGMTAREVAEALGVKDATVRGQLKAVFAKTGVNKAKDLVRLAAETSTLAALTGTAETVLEPPDPNGRLRVIASGERRIALTDYGPRSGKPVLVMHGAATGRRLPPAFVVALHARGYRPIVPQRPGFGLTDVATEPYLEQGADDMARIMDALRIDRGKLLVRDSSTPTGLYFASHHPDRVLAGVAVNPRWPAPGRFGAVRMPASLMGAVARAFVDNPHLIGLVAELLRRQTRTDLLEATMRQSLAHVAGDRVALQTPGVLDFLVRDAQGMFARSSTGFASENQAYAAGWTIPPDVGGASWTVAEGEQMALPQIEEVWSVLPNARFRIIPEAGLLVYFTHPAVIADMVANA
ncbi:MAG: alpha/beta fold hydrolase [Caulobacter sp.]|nr:alpha/beta fold hydrolase [Caulobacter sp.]